MMGSRPMRKAARNNKLISSLSCGGYESDSEFMLDTTTPKKAYLTNNTTSHETQLKNCEYLDLHTNVTPYTLTSNDNHTSITFDQNVGNKRGEKSKNSGAPTTKTSLSWILTWI